MPHAHVFCAAESGNRVSFTRRVQSLPLRSPFRIRDITPSAPVPCQSRNTNKSLLESSPHPPTHLATCKPRHSHGTMGTTHVQRRTLLSLHLEQARPDPQPKAVQLYAMLELSKCHGVKALSSHICSLCPVCQRASARVRPDSQPHRERSSYTSGLAGFLGRPVSAVCAPASPSQRHCAASSSP